MIQHYCSYLHFVQLFIPLFFTKKMYLFPLLIEVYLIWNKQNQKHKRTSQLMSTWISDLKSDDLPVSWLSIPGTHDSAAFKLGEQIGSFMGQAWWKCQDMNFQDQLSAGIRYFDLRFRYYPTTQNQGKNEEFHFHHGKAYLGSPDDAMQTLSKFLKNNPKEFIILQIQQELSDYDPSSFGQKIKAYLKKFDIPLYNWSSAKTIPLVKDLRGKAWLIQAAHVKMNQFEIDTDEPIRMMIKTTNYALQNAWNDPNGFMGNNDEKKEKAIKDLLNEGFQQGKILKINYISWQPGTKGCHNKFFEGLIGNYNHLGISVMDYPSKQLIQKIIKKNFK